MKAYFKYEDQNDAKGTFVSDFNRVYWNTTWKKVLTIINILTMITLIILPPSMRHILLNESNTAYLVGQIPGSVLSSSLVIIWWIMRDTSKYFRIGSTIEKWNMTLMTLTIAANAAWSAGIVYPIYSHRWAQMIVIFAVIWMIAIPYINRANSKNRKPI